MWIGLLIHLFSMEVLEANSRERGDSKIVGGNFVRDIREMPWIVNIEHHGSGHVCGGSVLTPKTVLTACHCLAAKVSNKTSVPSLLENKELFFFKTGSLLAGVNKSRERQSQTRKAKFFLIHPNCREVNLIQVFDYAVAVMKRPFIMNEYVQPIRIFSMDGEKLEKKMYEMLNDHKSVCYVAGWGEVRRGEFKDDDQGIMSKKLKMIRMHMVSEEKCREIYGNDAAQFKEFSFKENHQVCVTGKGGWGSDCQGDSGGPFVCDGYQVALVSYGFECGISIPAVYAGLDLFFPWFNDEVLRKISLRSTSSATHAWMPQPVLHKYIMYSLLLGFCGRYNVVML